MGLGLKVSGVVCGSGQIRGGLHKSLWVALHGSELQTASYAADSCKQREDLPFCSGLCPSAFPWGSSASG